MRVELPKHLVIVLDAYATAHNISAREAVKRLLDDLSSAFRKGPPSFLGPSWSEAIVSDDDVAVTADQLILLERSAKLPSGFAGVHANGAGWRANVRGRALTTRRSPERAALDRFLFLKESAVSSIDETIAWLRSRNPHASEEELRREAEDMESLRGGPTPPGM